MATKMNWASDEGRDLLGMAAMHWPPEMEDVRSWNMAKYHLALLAGTSTRAALIWYSHDDVVWILATVKVGTCACIGIAPDPILVADLGCLVVDPVEALVRAQGLWLNG